MWRVLLVLVATVHIAHADSVRAERPLALSLAFPDVIYFTDHDVTVPVPTLQVGYSISPLLSFELAAGGVPMGDGGKSMLAHAGAWYRLTDTTFAPYLMSRFGVWRLEPDEGSIENDVFALGGLGVEYVHRSGFTLWLDVGAGIGNAHGAAFALGGSLGVAVRL